MPTNARHYSFKLGEHEILTWPEHIAIELFNSQPTMGLVRFGDGDAYHPRLLSHILELEAESEFTQTVEGGAIKVNDLQDWDIVEADFITLRATKLCGDMMHSDKIRITSAYGLILRQGNYLPPQVSENAVASILYVVDPGEADPANGSSGKLSFTHQRLPGYTGHPPDPVTAGTMVAFPADMLSAALPYTGDRPRVLLYWHFLRG
jgi:hypothetical protein